MRFALLLFERYLVTRSVKLLCGCRFDHFQFLSVSRVVTNTPKLINIIMQNTHAHILSLAHTNTRISLKRA